MNLPQQLEELVSRAESRLISLLPPTDTNPAELHQAMQYAVLNGGKRVRPLLVYTTGLSLNGDLSTLDKPAVAVELIHAYSLIHDDLPAMDDADLRRGKPSCHKAFSEATAILAGDALLPLAFEIINAIESTTITATEKLAMITMLAKAAGSLSMVGGQVLDIAAENKAMTLPELNTLHKKKTGALITAAVMLGAIAAGCKDQTTLAILDDFAQKIGLAFQIQDDILDIEADTSTLGKEQGKDADLNKTTYPVLLGLDGAKEKMQTLYQQALDSLTSIISETSLLHLLTKQLISRYY